MLQYDKLKERSLGYRDAIAVPTEEIYVPPGDPVLPLHTAAQEALTEFRDVKLADVTALDIPFSTVEPSTPIRKRAEYITLERVFKFGATPGCKGCSFEGTTHNPKCRARFDALIKADRIATATRKYTKGIANDTVTCSRHTDARNANSRGSCSTATTNC